MGQEKKFSIAPLEKVSSRILVGALLLRLSFIKIPMVLNKKVLMRSLWVENLFLIIFYSCL